MRKNCGDTVNDILKHQNESNPYRIHPEIFNRLQGISSLAELVGSLAESEEALLSGPCSYCRKFAKYTKPRKLQVCARCDFIFYCSKECQKADWKMHKCNCRKLNTAALDRLYTLRMNLARYMKHNFEFAFSEMGLEASDLALEISFMPDENGVIPALDLDPPKFRVVPIRNYAAGEFPAWFPDGWNTDPQRKWLKDIAEILETVCKPAFGALVIYHAGRIHVVIGTIEQYYAPDFAISAYFEE